MLAPLADTKLIALGLVAFLAGTGVATFGPGGFGDGPVHEAGCAGLPGVEAPIAVQRREGPVNTNGDEAFRLIRWRLDGVDAGTAAVSLCVRAGTIHVETAPGEAIRLRAGLQAQGDDARAAVEAMDVEALFASTAKGLGLAAGQTERGEDLPAVERRVHMVLEVPRDVSVSLGTELGVGQTELEDVDLAAWTARVGTGEIEANGAQVAGPIDARVGTGEIDVEATPTGSARWSLDVGSGEVDVELPWGSDIGYDVTASTGAGDVEVAIGPTEAYSKDPDANGPGDEAHARSEGYSSARVRVEMEATASVGDVDVTAS